MEFSEEHYQKMIGELFVRFPSFQKVGGAAYKPGIENMRAFDEVLGHPHLKYKCIHVAGTNGKGSCSNMLASALASLGLKVGLYTSPHILDFRERMRIIQGDRVTRRQGDGAHEAIKQEESPLYYIGKEEVWDFVQRWRGEMERLDLSFFEITTAMAFDWFAREEVDLAVIETGLGGRLDSTNIITPILSVITNIGYDHCDMLGHTLAAIAGEKAGIIKPGVPAVIGESHPETDEVFVNSAQNGLLIFADQCEPMLWDRHEEILAKMDLQGDYQRKNLRTVLTALQTASLDSLDEGAIIDAIENTAKRMEFRGRWEKLCDEPMVIADIGHNSHGLRSNFAQLQRMMQSGKYDSLKIIYGTMADKDVEEIVALFPREAEFFFVTASNKRALPAEKILEKYLAAGRDPAKAHVATLQEVIGSLITPSSSCIPPVYPTSTSCLPHVYPMSTLIYIGGSAYLVSEALALI